jgi:uncharacterized membrane protein
VSESQIMIVLRLIHIIAGVFWGGGAMAVAWFIFPAQRAIGPSGMVFMRELMMNRKFRSYMVGAAVLTILSGLAMYMRMSMVTHGEWARSRMGMVLGIGAVAAIIAAGIGTGVTGRIGKKMMELGGQIQASGGPPSDAQKAEMEMLQGKMQGAFRTVAVLLLIAIAAMASARYL